MAVPPAPGNPSQRADWRSAAYRFSCAVLIALTLWAYIETARQTGPVITPLTRDYTERLSSGHASLSTTPRPELLALPNPYDPKANEGFRLFDASLYNGKYYLYFGLTPFATLLVPWYKVTGQHLPNTTAVLFYCAAGFVAYAAALVQIRRRLMPASGRFGTLMGIGLAGWCAGQLSLLRLPDIHDLEISAAYFCFSITLFASLQAAIKRANPTLWLALAAAMLGLGVGARPILALTVPFFLWFGARVLLEHSFPRWRGCLALLGPLAMIGGALAAYNYVRFDNPLEFGIRYQLSTLDRVHQPTFLLERVPYSISRYLLGGFRLGPYFPFIEGDRPDLLPRPASHDEPGNFYGFLITTPVLLLLALAPRVLKRAPLAPLRGIAWFGLGAAAVQWLTFLPSGMAAHRYALDLLPPLLLVVGIVLQGFVESTGWRALCLTGALYSCLLGYLQSAALYGIFEGSQSAAFHRVARVFNFPVYLVQRAAGHHPSHPRLTLQFSPQPPTPNEPLLACGQPGRENFIFVNHAGPDLIRLGIEVMGRGGPVSGFLPVDRSKPQVVDLDLGIFYPPPGHPLYHGLDVNSVRTWRRRAVIRLNGVVVLDSLVDFHPPRRILQWGASAHNAAFGEHFSGGILMRDTVRLQVGPDRN